LNIRPLDDAFIHEKKEIQANMPTLHVDYFRQFLHWNLLSALYLRDMIPDSGDLTSAFSGLISGHLGRIKSTVACQNSKETNAIRTPPK